MQMLHNNYCTKSLCALDLLKANNLEAELVDYLKNPLNEAELTTLLAKLRIPASDLVRKSEPVYQKKFLGKTLTEQEWIRAMVDHPVLIERPIFVNGDKAVIGRPAERIFEIL